MKRSLFSLLVLWPALVIAQDVTPPTLVSLTLEPTTINVWESDQEVTFTFHVTDDLSGIGDNTYAVVRSPLGGQQHTAFTRNGILLSGDFNDGIFQDVVTWPRYSETGTWKLERMRLNDRVGNDEMLWTDDLEAMGINTTLTVIAVAIPEPASIALFLAGIVGLAGIRRQRSR